MGRMRGGSQRCCERGGTRERDRQPRHACMQRAYAPHTFGPRSEAGGPHSDFVSRSLRSVPARKRGTGRTRAAFTAGCVRRGPFGRGGRWRTTCATRGDVRRGYSREGCAASGARCAGFLLRSPCDGWGAEPQLDAHVVQWRVSRVEPSGAAARLSLGPSAGRDGSNPSPRWFS
jgi:hypothetical protein